MSSTINHRRTDVSRSRSHKKAKAEATQPYGGVCVTQTLIWRRRRPCMGTISHRRLNERIPGLLLYVVGARFRHVLDASLPERSGRPPIISRPINNTRLSLCKRQLNTLLVRRWAKRCASSECAMDYAADFCSSGAKREGIAEGDIGDPTCCPYRTQRREGPEGWREGLTHFSPLNKRYRRAYPIIRARPV